MAPTTEIRENFHQLIDSIQDEYALSSLYSAVSLYVEQQDVLLDSADPVILARMQKSLGQAARGEVITNEEMQEQVRQWLGK